MDKRYDTYERSTVSKKRYGRAWKRIRDRYIGKHPLCEMCLKNHKTTPATEVHHIRPLSRGGTHDEDNLMALCKPCHSKITAEMDDRWHHAKKEYRYE
ncbi:HNH endonuclease [Megasphaera cerevisiae]